MKKQKVTVSPNMFSNGDINCYYNRMSLICSVLGTELVSGNLDNQLGLVRLTPNLLKCP